MTIRLKMATLGGKRIHLLITDSRGTGLGDLVRKGNPAQEHFEVKVCRGATINEMVDEASRHLQRCPFDVVYIAGGACDITTKNYFTKIVSYEWEGEKALSNHLVKVIKNAHKKLREFFPASRVVFCSLIGSELSRVVKAHHTTDRQQTEVNEAVPRCLK